MKKLVLALLVLVGIASVGQAAEPALLLKKPRVSLGQQLSEYVQFYLNPKPVKKGSKVHELFVYTGQTELTGQVAITLVDDGGTLFKTSDLMQGTYKGLGMSIILIELDREISENLDSVKLQSVRAKSRLIQSLREIEAKL